MHFLFFSWQGRLMNAVKEALRITHWDLLYREGDRQLWLEPGAAENHIRSQWYSCGNKLSDRRLLSITKASGGLRIQSSDPSGVTPPAVCEKQPFDGAKFIVTTVNLLLMPKVSKHWILSSTNLKKPPKWAATNHFTGQQQTGKQTASVLNEKSDWVTMTIWWYLLVFIQSNGAARWVWSRRRFLPKYGQISV